ncbi:MAG TPA: hypothetical protein VFL76_03655 [Edaphocola sp.]|nr:hypothetical protein [Edaphocola sp.]
MQTGILDFHSAMRYLIILVALWTLIQLASGLNGKKKFTSVDKRPGMIFMILMDIQLLAGLFLYFFGSWGLKSIRSYGMGETMRNSMTRFFAIEHETGMLIALILVHIAYALTKKTKLSDKTRFSKPFWLFLIAFLFILSFIPWPFRESLGRGTWF